MKKPPKSADDTATNVEVPLIERGLAPSRKAPELGPPIKLKGSPLTPKVIKKWIAGRRA
jgi:hypothetical protein